MPNDPLVCVRVFEGDRLRVEHEACIRPAIQSVPDDRDTDAPRMRRMDAQLMRTSRTR